MASIRQLKSKRFVAEVRKHRQYTSKTFNTKIQAMAWAAETEQSLSPFPDIQITGKTLAQAFERYRDEISPGKKGYRSETVRLNKFIRDPIAAMPLNEIKPLHVYDWIEEQLKTIKSSSVNRYLNLFSSVFEQAKRWNWTDANPVRGIKRPRNPHPRERRISDWEIKQILDALGFDGEHVSSVRDVIAVAFLFALETAMRQGEIWGMRWEDVYLKQSFVRLHETKNGTKRDVPLSREAVRLLQLLPRAGNAKVFYTNQASSGSIFRRCVASAGIKGLTFHDTRHEALTRLAQKLSVLDLARMVGHRDPRSLMIYYNPTAEEIARQLG